jgi:glycosyltransferase involved in cell wall biosynthesis/SAM-dependent methyltransferase
MKSPSAIGQPLVSVIIPCYNYGHFLAEAIESVLQQAYPAKEIVVVDDGSTDDTQAVAARYPEIIYVYQPNQGLSAARNTGIQKSHGIYLVFLDADDWLFPGAMALNVFYLQQHPQAAFVAGAHTLYYTTGEAPQPKPTIVADNPYNTFLFRGNFIAMIAAAMFARWVFDKITFDISLANCEDYDLFLKIARHYPCIQHNHQLAAYRMHSAAMSTASGAMLSGALKVLNRQKEYLRNPGEIEAYYRGIHFWNMYYSGGQDFKLHPGKPPNLFETLAFFRAHGSQAPFDKALMQAISSYYLTRTKSMIKASLKSLVPAAGKQWLRDIGLLGQHLPEVGQVALGDLKSLVPFSTEFGYDRGGPIDRYYIENFLRKEAASISGRVLEIGDNAYTLQYGGKQVSQSDILHIDASNPQATFVGDLSAAPHIPDNTFNCLVLTQTLHLIYDFKAALHTCHRILKPGGVLLLTVPGITPIDKGEWKETWYWTFTDKALHRLLAETFLEGTVELASFGNVRVATAYLYGMGLPEIPEEFLNYYDPQFQVINTVKVVKHAPLT